jgi:hypothetical protein
MSQTDNRYADMRRAVTSTVKRQNGRGMALDSEYSYGIFPVFILDTRPIHLFAPIDLLIG